MTNEQLIARIRERGHTPDYMLQLWQQNQGIIFIFAKKFAGLAEMDDLLQESYLALCGAVKTYREDEGILFTTYLTVCLKRALKRYINTCCSQIRVPEVTAANLAAYEQFILQFKECYDREPTDLEVMEHMDISENTLAILQKAGNARSLASLDSPVNTEDDGGTLGDLMADPAVNLEQDATRRYDHELMTVELCKLIDRLPEEQREAVNGKYLKGKTYNILEQETGRNKGSIRQDCQAGLAKLARRSKKNDAIQEYWDGYLSASARNVSLSEYRTTWTSQEELYVIREEERQNTKKMPKKVCVR